MSTTFHLHSPIGFSIDNLNAIQKGWDDWQLWIQGIKQRNPNWSLNSTHTFSSIEQNSIPGEVQLTISGSQTYFEIKLFEDSFPDPVIAQVLKFPLSVRKYLELGFSTPHSPVQLHAFYTEREHKAIEKAKTLWPESIVEKIDLRFSCSNQRPALKVKANSERWVQCPYCGFRFWLEDKNAFTNGRHHRCQQELLVIS